MTSQVKVGSTGSTETFTFGTPKSPPKLKLNALPRRVRVAFPRMPPTRTSCTFDREGGEESVTVDWDPLVNRGLLRETTLPEGTYRISCASEAARHALDAKANYAWTFRADASDAGDKSSDQNATLAFCDPAETGISDKCLKDDANTRAEITLAEALPLAGAQAATDRNQLFLSATPAPALSINNALRSFGGLSDEAINEAFQVIAEVVVEEAKSKGMKLVTSKLRALLCEDLTVSTSAAGRKSEPVLARTCDAIRTLRLEDLASSGRQLLDAFIEDLVRVAVDTAIKKSGLKSDAFKHLVPIAAEGAVDAVLGREEKLRNSGQRLLLKLLEEAAASGAPELRFAVTLFQECRASRCDAARIRRMVAHPDRYFSLDATTTTALQTALEKWPDYESFVAALLRLAAPSADMTETAQLKMAVELVMDVVERLEANGVSYATPAGDRALRPPENNAEWIGVLRAALSAAIEQDVTKLTVPSVRMLRKLFPDPNSAALKYEDGKVNHYLLMVARLGGTLGNFLATSITGRTPTKEELEERRKAKKEAFRSLIESQTERRLRLGDCILSLGSSVGFFGAGQWNGSGDLAHFRMQPTVTLGIAFDAHAKSGFGFHAEVMPLNLGSYASLVTQGSSAAGASGAVAPPSPGDAVSPSVTIGASYVVDSADLVLIWGGTMGYASKLGTLTEMGGTTPDPKSYQGFYLGMMFGGYIPVFDLN